MLGDNTTMDWTTLTLRNFEEYLVTDSGPVTTPTATTPTVVATAPVDVPAITSAVTSAMLARAPMSHTNMFMKKKGGADDVKLLKEPNSGILGNIPSCRLHMHMTLRMLPTSHMHLIPSIPMHVLYLNYRRNMPLVSLLL